VKLDLILLSLSLFLIALGIAVIRVGLIGEHLGRLRLVSFVKKYPDAPRSHHRMITAGLGAIFVPLGFGFTILSFLIP